MHIEIIQELSGEQFRDRVRKGKDLMIVEFWNRDSGTCDIMEPIYNKLADTFRSKLGFYRCHVDLESNSYRDLNLTRVPSYAIYKGSRIVEMIQGILPYSKFSNRLSSL